MLSLHLFLDVVILARHKWQMVHINDCNLCFFYIAKTSVCIFSFYWVNYLALRKSTLAVLCTNTRFLMSLSHMLGNEDLNHPIGSRRSLSLTVSLYLWS